MGDYSKEHTKQMPGKNANNTSKPMATTNQVSGKSHEKAISLGEGLPMGSVHSAHTKEDVHMAKDNHAPHKAAHAMRTRAISGNAGTMGEGSVANQATGHGPLMSSLQDKKVQKKAHAFNERSIAGNADPCAGMDCE